MTERPATEVTARVLSTGTLVAAALFACSFVLTLFGEAAASVLVARVGLVALLATPAVGLLASAAELRYVQPRVAALALLVLLILAAAAAIAFAAGQ